MAQPHRSIPDRAAAVLARRRKAGQFLARHWRNLRNHRRPRAGHHITFYGGSPFKRTDPR